MAKYKIKKEFEKGLISLGHGITLSKEDVESGDMDKFIDASKEAKKFVDVVTQKK